MSDLPIEKLFGLLACLIVLSAFFSGSETALMSLNRYRLKHLVKAGHRGAILAEHLLQSPDRLIGLILLGNNFVNIMASMLATLIALRVWGDAGIALAGGLLTLVVLIFAEVAPKTLAALHPEKIAFPAAFIYYPMLKIFYPLVWMVNFIANGFLSLLRISSDQTDVMALSQEELRIVVLEAGALVPKRHKRMLLSILDLEKATVDDIVCPRNEIVGIDLNDSWDDILTQIETSQHTRLPIFKDTIDDTVGIVHLRNVLSRLAAGQLNPASLIELAREPYYVPEGTPLNTQLLNFQRLQRRIGLVVDEYGDILGLVTLEDILEEIVGEFTTDPSYDVKDVVAQKDGSFMVDGTVNLRTLNRRLGWTLKTTGPKTLNGLILEYLEDIPEPGTSIKVGNYAMEIMQTHHNSVKTVRIQPLAPELKKPTA